MLSMSVVPVCVILWLHIAKVSTTTWDEIKRKGIYYYIRIHTTYVDISGQLQWIEIMLPSTVNSMQRGVKSEVGKKVLELAAHFLFSHKSVCVFMSGSNLSHSARYCLANARSKPHFYNGGASNWLWKRYKRP